jgi:hypothetical protein
VTLYQLLADGDRGAVTQTLPMTTPKTGDAAEARTVLQRPVHAGSDRRLAPARLLAHRPHSRCRAAGRSMATLPDADRRLRCALARVGRLWRGRDRCRIPPRRRGSKAGAAGGGDRSPFLAEERQALPSRCRR